MVNFFFFPLKSSCNRVVFQAQDGYEAMKADLAVPGINRRTSSLNLGKGHDLCLVR